MAIKFLFLVSMEPLNVGAEWPEVTPENTRRDIYDALVTHPTLGSMCPEVAVTDPAPTDQPCPPCLYCGTKMNWGMPHHCPIGPPAYRSATAMLVCKKCGASWDASTDVYHACEVPKSLPVWIRPIVGLGALSPLHLVVVGFLVGFVVTALLIGAKS